MDLNPLHAILFLDQALEMLQAPCIMLRLALRTRSAVGGRESDRDSLPSYEHFQMSNQGIKGDHG